MCRGLHFFMEKINNILRIGFFIYNSTVEQSRELSLLVTYLLTPWSRVLLEKLTSKLCRQKRNNPRLWNPKVPHRTDKCTPPVPILNQLHPVPTTPSNFLKDHLNIIILYKSWSPQWPRSHRLPHQHPVHPNILPHTRHMPCQSHSSRFYHRTILDKEHSSFSSSLCSFLHSPVTPSLLGPNTLLNTLFSNTLSLRFSLNVRDQVSHPYKTTGKIIVLYILTYKFLDSNLKDIRFCTE